MTYDAASDSWKISGIVFPANTEYKFRMNAGWDLPDAYNLGAGDAGLVFNGDNIKVVEAGNYKVTLDIANTAKYRLLR
jgi:hypothetical protein